MKYSCGWYLPEKDKYIEKQAKKYSNLITKEGKFAYQGDIIKGCINKIPEYKRNTAIDIGGHIGIWSYYLSKYFNSVISFEPLKKHQDCWRRNLQDIDNVELYTCALGGYYKKEKIISPKDSTISSFIDIGNYDLKVESDIETQDIVVKDLDSYNFKNVDFIKIDVEGYELEVLKGAKQTILDNKPFICIEDLTENLDSIKYLINLGMEIKSFDKNNYFLDWEKREEKFSDYANLYLLGRILHEEYINNKPFPHIILDDFLPIDMYNNIKENFPNKFDKNENDNVKGKWTLEGIKTKNNRPAIKDGNVNPIFREFLLELNSALFLEFLERISGIKGLIGDPYWQEAGAHIVERGGFLNSHADFSHHKYLGLERRLNFFIFFNDNWREEYNGHLCLFDEQGNAMQKILPIANRCVIFTTSPISFHGHPAPLMCPETESRKSLALYYYTSPTLEREKSLIVYQ